MVYFKIELLMQQIYDDLAWGSLQEAPISDILFPVEAQIGKEFLISFITKLQIGLFKLIVMQ